MSDVIKMVRPPPRNDKGEADAVREALYGYLIGKNVERAKLPPLPQAFRHGILDDLEMTENVAEQLADPEAIKRSRPLPKVNALDSVVANAALFASLPSGGTACAAPLRWLNARRTSTGPRRVGHGVRQSGLVGLSYRSSRNHRERDA